MEQQSKIKFDLHLPLILIHTPYGLRFFDRIAKTRAARFYAKFNTYLMPLITIMALFLIVGSVAALFSSETIREGARGVGPQANLLIPGLNPYLPIWEGWIALVITIIVHEAGHGIIARVYGVKVESTGLVLFLGIPIGAFVNIERDELNGISMKQKSSILTAGPMTNILLAAISLIAILLITSSLIITKPIDPDLYGVVITNVNSGSLAESIGLQKGDTIQQIQDTQIRDPTQLNENLNNNLGKSVTIEVITESGQQITKDATLPAQREPGKGILGVSITPIADPKEVLDRYNTMVFTSPLGLLAPPTFVQGMVPFSDFMADKYTSPIFGSYYTIPANLFFWLWFINFNVAIFNALPIGPLDGGQLYNSLIDKKTQNKRGLLKYSSKIVTYGMVIVVVLSIALPYLLK
ncbi:site-2 protease family protein [Candidatus Nitrosocosmicus franklandus]|uniref:Zinc metallopeptidase RseP n=1 Tax=Candidatus Nitrosocosmicus franklandianus TaxID=1798806 RepID=A0A484I443_9ARCH|nr:site-2 protease family protein [Candidatus Nitrosocosmicus franklandus]VFJ12425.1 Zinc metallopeptidase RseP [Candidatus Nitrosocosmicus franklandus]